MPVLAATIRRLGDGFSHEELERARAQLKAGLLMSLESTMTRVEQHAGAMMVFGRPFDLDDMVRRIDAVDHDGVKRVAHRLKSAPPTVTALGPIGALESYDRIARRLDA